MARHFPSASFAAASRNGYHWNETRYDDDAADEVLRLSPEARLARARDAQANARAYRARNAEALEARRLRNCPPRAPYPTDAQVIEEVVDLTATARESGLFVDENGKIWKYNPETQEFSDSARVFDDRSGEMIAVPLGDVAPNQVADLFGVAEDE
jgi:hypothetical protein